MAPQKLNHIADFKNKQVRSFARRETISKMKSIISNHNMSPEYQHIATANIGVPTSSSSRLPQAANTFLDTHGRVTAFNRRSLIH